MNSDIAPQDVIKTPTPHSSPWRPSVLSPQSSVLRTEFALYLRFIGARVRSQMQYKASLIIDVISRFLINGLELAAIFILFNRFSSLAGWSVGEIAFLYGLVTVSFALHEVVAQSFEDFSLT